MKYTKITSWFLAISMLLFGTLKFFNPFKGWYLVQIENSNLGHLSYAMGIMGEITVGLLLVLSLIYQRQMTAKTYKRINTFSFITIIMIMLTGIYVHLHPNVPADVLPLKIKPPYIPVLFIAIALSNIFLLQKGKKL